MKNLRDFLGIGMDKVNVVKILLKDKKYEVAIEPYDVSILTIFTDPSFVSHCFQFKHSIQADQLVEDLREIISTNKWNDFLSVLPAFPDGGVQIVRKDSKSGHPIDKSCLREVIAKMYPRTNHLPIAMFGDGHNDIPAMKVRNVIPLSFANAHEDIQEFIKMQKGHLSKFNAPEDLGVVDGLLYLAKKDFFKKDSRKIIDLIKNSFPNLV
ncbi:hypothetical protein GYA19_06010 [Candidatus Beckwithbacteria bacterium]|nr:hypothetical protein [Candidatus Beckwithbacteria bacterium]